MTDGPIDEQVRRARPTDVDELRRVEQIARDGIVDARGGALLLAERPAIRWDDVIDDPGHDVFAATLDDHIVGLLVMHADEAAERAVVDLVYVEADARELGLGDGLVEAAVEAVVARGLVGIEATALPGDRETKNLFERAGLTARKLTVYKRLSTQGDD